jgi:hypothetical protein
MTMWWWSRRHLGNHALKGDHAVRTAELEAEVPAEDFRRAQILDGVAEGFGRRRETAIFGATALVLPGRYSRKLT